MKQRQILELEGRSEYSTGKFNLRAYASDTLTMIAFGLPVAGANELLIGGMSLEETAKSRLLAIPFALVIARPCGKYRDLVFSKLGVTKESNWFKKYVGDTFVFGTSQAPLYALALGMVGAEPDEIYRAVGTMTALSPFFGRPYGLCLGFFRGLFKVKQNYQETK